MQLIKLLASGLLALTVLGSSLPTGTATSDDLILQQIAGYRSWNRVHQKSSNSFQMGLRLIARSRVERLVRPSAKDAIQSLSGHRRVKRESCLIVCLARAGLGLKNHTTMRATSVLCM
jgi:hypothetical protein